MRGVLSLRDSTKNERDAANLFSGIWTFVTGPLEIFKGEPGKPTLK